jgi:hypothetical protein
LSQAHLIAKSFKDRISASEELNNALPGALHYGAHADTGTVLPFGLLTVQELGRVYHSGGAALAEYEATLSIYGSQKVGAVGDIQSLFASAFNLSRNLPSVVGQVILCLPTSASLIEDEESEFGVDIMRSTQTWQITIQEASTVGD